ncbi:hypothetical protein DXG01_003070 [Tephrocybe rancida]|nr:hypothetical protein DXG01_003070 [Tephrocybe rancida]
MDTEVNMVAGAPSNTKKSTLDTHRGDTKPDAPQTRSFVARPPQKQPTMPPPVPSSSKAQRGKRKSKSVLERGSHETARKKRKTKGKARAQEDDEISSNSEESDDDYNPTEPRRLRRATRPPVEEAQEADGPFDEANPTIGVTSQMGDVDMIDQTPNRDGPPLTTTIEFENLEEEQKPKPILQLRYQGFNLYGHCLCVVVEPWPPIRSMSRALSVATVLREPSIAPPRSVLAQEPGTRAKTPLFLPDDYRERSETPTLSRERSFHPPATSSLLDPNFLEDSEDSDDDGGMMLFSQVLNNAGDVRAGAADDGEDMDTDIFFGDADEMKEL